MSTPNSTLSAERGIAEPIPGSQVLLAHDKKPMTLFPNNADIGSPSKKGGVIFDPIEFSYKVSGGGENMWFTNDAFHFASTTMTGNFELSAGIEWLTAGGNAHKKGCLVVRQDLTPGSAYVDVAVHADGLTSLQFREQANGLTHEVQANVKGPSRVGLGRQGDTFYLLVERDGTMHQSGAFKRIAFKDPVYVGIGVCSHDDKVLETAKFTRVRLDAKKVSSTAKPVLHCALETVPIGSKDRKAVYYTQEHIEAPNWLRDGSGFLFNSKGSIYKLPLTGGTAVKIDPGFANKCNNDHGLSQDGSQLAISDQSQGDGKSLIYVVPATGGTPRLVTQTGPSYWHGWSPDGRELAYCAERNGEYDVYTIPISGGEEKRLTTAKGLDDGPDYSPDSQYIYFNSDRTGSMHIWRMKRDGSEQQQLTFDEHNDWFPHPSPDGKYLVFVSYEKDVTGHPANKPVKLRLMPAAGGPIQELASLFGGQGTLNVPSWSPDSKTLAFVSYELLTPWDK